MGNSTSGPTHARGNKSSYNVHGTNAQTLRQKEKNATSGGRGKPFSVVVDQKLPALTILQDSGSQTTKSYKRVNNGFVCCSYFLMVTFVLYFLLCFLMISSHYFQSLACYAHIVKWHNRDLTDLGVLGLVEARNVVFRTEDGLHLKGWHLLPPDRAVIQASITNHTEREVFFDFELAHAERIVVFFHGNSATRGQPFRVDLIKMLAVYLNAHVISFDYRGFADSEGSPTEYGTHLDSRAVVQWIDSTVLKYNQRANGYLGNTFSKLRRANQDSFDIIAKAYELAGRSLLASTSTSNADSSSSAAAAMTNRQPYLYFYGHSLGSAISTTIAAEMNTNRPGSLSGLVLDAPIISLAEAGKTHPIGAIFRIFPSIFSLITKYAQFKYATIEKIEYVNAPIIMLHGLDDHRIPPYNSAALFTVVTNNTGVLMDSSRSSADPNTTTLAAAATTVAPAAAPAAAAKGKSKANVSYAHFKGIAAPRDGGKTCSIAPSSRAATATATTTATPATLSTNLCRSTVASDACNYPVDLHKIPRASHNDVHKTQKWLSLLPAFIKKAEQFAEQNDCIYEEG